MIVLRSKGEEMKRKPNLIKFFASMNNVLLKSLFLFLFAVSFVSSPALSFAALNDGLVAYYPFNGNGNDGTVFGATLTPDRFGNANSAFSFDGQSSYLTFPNTLNDGSPASISLWFRLGSTTNTQPFVFGNYDYIQTSCTANGTRFDGFNVRITEDRKLMFGTAASGGVVKTNISINEDVWYFMSLVYDTNTIKISVNGQMETISDANILNGGETAGLGSVYTKLVAGLRSNGLNCGVVTNPNHFFLGELDDIRIYNRALSTAEIESIRTVDDDLSKGLVAYYPFNGNANDESGNGNHAVVNGGGSIGLDRFGNQSAYSFNGVDSYLAIADSPFLNFGTSDFSTSFWVMSSSNNTQLVYQKGGRFR